MKKTKFMIPFLTWAPAIWAIAMGPPRESGETTPWTIFTMLMTVSSVMFHVCSTPDQRARKGFWRSRKVLLDAPTPIFQMSTSSPKMLFPLASSGFTRISCSAPSRFTFTASSRPSLREIVSASSPQRITVFPSMATTWSPARKPAASAGDPGWMLPMSVVRLGTPTM